MSFQELGQASCPVGSRFGGLCKPAAASGGPQGMAQQAGRRPFRCSAAQCVIRTSLAAAAAARPRPGTNVNLLQNPF